MREIFVYGSNTEGIPGAGAALFAYRNHGAVKGHKFGLCGNSYAIITKDLSAGVRSIPLVLIHAQVAAMLALAIALEESLVFNVTAIGCGLAGYRPEEIAPMFIGAPANVRLPKEFTDILNKT